MRIVPPARTVTPDPLPKAATASSREAGTTTSAASRAVELTWAAPPRLPAGRILSSSAQTAQQASSPLRLRLAIVSDVAFATIDELAEGLRLAAYLPERGLATALYLSLALEKPLLLEGEAGVGKTEAAKALARATSSRLIRLQCYEGLDISHAVYEWNYSRQLLHIRAAQEGTVSEQELFGPDFLIRRPLLEAIERSEEHTSELQSLRHL